ncbi:MAG: AAA family ATPase [bacterium]|nr:AAA family ATPase [bacterium]
MDRDGCTHLDVWRGFTFLPGYIACIKEKQRIISDVGRGLRTFKNEGRHVSSYRLLLQADPGAGKTFLAKSFAKALNFYFLRFDITQMLSRDDLLEVFDAIATQQANEDREILVFVDEINAPLAGFPVYGAFLSPLEEGYYVRKGRSFSLRPCAWIFAGTNIREDEVRKADKLSDFESRMTMIERIDFGSLAEAYKKDSEKLQREARLEQVYLGAAMIHQFFSDVTEISAAVLKQFGKLDPAKSPARRIRGMAESLKDVQYGRVSRVNCESWKNVPWEKNEDDKIFVHVHF